jgi:hypothetical protein
MTAPNTLLLNRLKQGILAAIGTAAITALTIFRIASGRDVDINFRNSALLTATLSAVIGSIWTFMPRAADDIEESVDTMKEEMNPVVRTAINSALDEGTKPTHESSYSRGYNKVRSINDDDIYDDDDGWESVKPHWEL